MAHFDHDLSNDGKTQHVVACFESEVIANPANYRNYSDMGLWWVWHGRYGDAMKLLDKAIQLKPKFAWALCARASLRATCPETRYRDGVGAVEDATKALEFADALDHLSTEWVRRTYVQTLAAAYAEAGDFDHAVEQQQLALELAGTKRAKEEVTSRLMSYQAGKPLRESGGLVNSNPTWLSD